MKTAYEHINEISNVGPAERVFRAVWGGVAMLAVLSGTIASEGAIALAVLVGLYLSVTAVLSLDPFYAAANSFLGRQASGRGGQSWNSFHGGQAIPVRINRPGYR